MPGPPPSGDRAATPAERSAAYRARRKATIAAVPTKPPAVVRYRRPADRRSRPQQWADAVQTLADLLDRFQEWRDNLPPSLANSATAEALDAVLELRGYVEYDRLLGGIADSPLVKFRGSTDQVTYGLGVAYSFDVGIR